MAYEMASAAATHAFVDSIAAAMQAKGYTTKVTYDVMDGNHILPNAKLDYQKPGYKQVLTDYWTAALPRYDTPTSIADFLDDKYMSIANPISVIPVLNLPDTQIVDSSNVSGSIAANPVDQTKTTTTGVTTDPGVGSGVGMSVFEQVQAQAAANGHTGTLTFWQWNYYYEQVTGHPGPAPESYGIAGTQQLRASEWWALVGSAGAGSGAGPGVQGRKFRDLWIKFLAWLLAGRKLA